MGAIEPQRTIGDGTVGKALDVLDQVASFERPVRFKTLLENSPYPKATLYRLLQTLTSQQMLSYDLERQTYAPGVRLVSLAHSAWANFSLAPIARQFIDQLADKTGETIHLAQMQSGQVLYVDKRGPREPIEMFSQAGKIGPGYCTGIGKAIMAFMDAQTLERVLQQQAYFSYTPNTHTSAEDLRTELTEIETTGFAFDREEHEPGIICIATPIRSNARVIGGISITGLTSKTSLEGLAKHKQALSETAKAIGEAARQWQFPAQN